MAKALRRFLPGSFSLKHVGFDAALLLISLYFSLWLRLGFLRIDEHLSALNHFAAIFVALRLLCLMGFGVYQSMWRYISVPDAVTLAKGVALSIPVLVSTTYLIPSFGTLPRSLFVIDGFVAMALMMGARLARRRLYEAKGAKQPATQKLGKIIIYGAGTNGRHLAQRLLSDPSRSYEILGFVDDDTKKRDKRIGGLQVLGNGSELEDLIYRTGATDLIVAVSQPPTELLRQLVTLGRKYRIRPQVINNLNAQAINPKQAQLYRQVDLTDLLNRPPAQIDLNAVRSMVQGRRVLVTGAGGSIGSELARQVARFEPARLLLLDHSEFNLYEIDRELRSSTDGAGSTVVPLLLDIKDKAAIERVFKDFSPEVVLHAAAYKHVHLVEANPFAAILNNVLGTRNLLELSEAFNVGRFLLISTDKAVNPGGVMGATKRVCELLTTHWGFATGRPYSSVRFGNVLGSSGSLIPLLRQQIQDGGPLTLTHPDMTRYFMLIPEAVSLVLMSSFLSKPGDISVLRMGEPIRIYDLARSLLALVGKTEEEIPIMFTGVRPGEKMFEELYLRGDELTTPHPDILTVPMGDVRTGLNRSEILNRVDKLIAMAQVGEATATEELRRLVRATTLDASAALTDSRVN